MSLGQRLLLQGRSVGTFQKREAAPVKLPKTISVRLNHLGEYETPKGKIVPAMVLLFHYQLV